MKILYILLILTFFSNVSCKKLNKLTQFNIEYDETIVIPSNTGITLPFVILTPDMPTNSESVFEVNDTRKDLIEQIVLKELTLTIQSPNSSNFNFLKTVRIFINADGLNETKVAFKENMGNTNSQSISLDVTGADLQEYIKKDSFKLRVETITDEAISNDYEILMHSVFFVDAKLRK